MSFSSNADDMSVMDPTDQTLIVEEENPNDIQVKPQKIVPSLHLPDDKTWTLYVLHDDKLDYYYVGMTKNLDARVNSHRNGNGSVWTKNRNFELFSTIDGVDEDDEDKYVVRLMKQVGIKNVRGGNFSNIMLTESQIDVLRSKMRETSNACFTCGASDHMGHQCPSKKTNDNREELENVVITGPRCLHCTKIGHLKPDCPDLDKIVCNNCGVHGHIRPNCPEPENPATLYCQDCAKYGHRQPNCPFKKPKKDHTNYICSNCGLKGHAIQDCKTLVCLNCKGPHLITSCPTRGGTLASGSSDKISVGNNDNSKKRRLE